MFSINWMIAICVHIACANGEYLCWENGFNKLIWIVVFHIKRDNSKIIYLSENGKAYND